MKEQKPNLSLKISYYFPLSSVIELIAILIIIGVPIFSNIFKSVVLLSLLSEPLNSLEPTLISATVIITVTWLAMLLATINFQSDNGFHNYFLSWAQTASLRDTCKIKPKINQIKQDNIWQQQKIISPDEWEYNQAIKSWYVDRRKNGVTVWLLVPQTPSAQSIFNQQLNIITDNIKHANPGYIFSPAERIGNYYKLEADHC